MRLQTLRTIKPLFLIPLFLLVISCTAGGEQFAPESPAGFWYGLWHGIISVISLVVHVFNENVVIYEINNTGGWYDFGFLIGVICIWSGGSHYSCKSAAEKKSNKEWDEIGDKVELKVMRKLKDWAADEEGAENSDDWDEIGDKVEKKLKRKIREWAEKE